MSRAGSKKIILTTLGALGVVYGDIGTSPLYAINEIFFGHGLPHYTPADVIGAISIVIWALTLVIAIKYIVFVLRADNDGEGGVFSLYSLIKSQKNAPTLILVLLLFGAGLLYGDGIITPAISVISAVEGLAIVTEVFHPYIIPITIAILVGLFSIQKFGTHKIGQLFGPVMLVWFGTIGFFGLASVISSPAILASLNPWYALGFLTSHSLSTILLILGSVMLVITGGEALYADMGHFGRTPIRLGWFAVAYPALALNYLGQGAYLLSGQTVLNHNIFYSMIPTIFLIPVIILATLATIIASQALISGAFSLTMQAISLRLLPYLPIKHTHEDHHGQIYIPTINWALLLGAVILVLSFGSSTKLAGAYGLAVSAIMLVTTLGIMVVAKNLWHWNKWLSIGIFLPFALLEFLFLGANSLKIFQGGIIPLTIGLVIFGLIETWKWGRAHTIRAFDKSPIMTVKNLIKIQNATKVDLKRTMIFMTRKPILNDTDPLPIQVQKFWQRNGILPHHIVLLNVDLLKTPHAKIPLTINHFTKPLSKNGSITAISAQFGFMEDPELEPLIHRFIRHHDIPSTDPVANWSFKIVHEKIFADRNLNPWRKIMFGVYNFLHHNSDSADHYFGLGQNRNLTIDVLPVVIK